MDSSRREQLQQQLITVETAIQNLVAGAVKSYQIGQRSFTYLDLNELLNWRKQLLTELQMIDYVVTQYVNNTSEDGSTI